LFKLVFFAEPQSCNPYIHIGFMRVLYTRSLVFKLVNLFLDNNVFSDLDRALSIILLAFMCLFQVNLWSKIKPKYLAASEGGIDILLIVTFGQ